MEYLNILKKDRRFLFIVFCVFFICAIPFFFMDLNILINARDSSYTSSDISQALKMVVSFSAFLVVDIPSNKFFFSLMLDIKVKKECTASVNFIKVKPSRFYNYIPGTKSENDYFYKCYLKTNKGKRMKIIIFKDLMEEIKEKTDNHTYSVTYYRYSKVATHIEKTD